MTPTLGGRWQTRLLLLATIGGLITLGFGRGWFGLPPGLTYTYVLGYVALFGLGWDGVYMQIQRSRWDQDWPAIFQWGAAIGEGIWLLGLIKLVGLPGVPRSLPISQFVIHYGLVWLGVFLASQSLLRILFPRWRFRGGRIW